MDYCTPDNGQMGVPNDSSPKDFEFPGMEMRWERAIQGFSAMSKEPVVAAEPRASMTTRGQEYRTEVLKLRDFHVLGDRCFCFGPRGT